MLAVRLEVSGPAAHGSTPWLGDNAILKAHDVFRRIETLPFSRESSDLFDRPSINLARIQGGDAFNKVPDRCWMDVDIRYLPGQDPGAILAQIRAIGDVEIVQSSSARRRSSRAEPVRARAARGGAALHRGRALASAATARPMRSRSSRRGSRPSSSGRSAEATTGRRNGSRWPRWPATGRRSATSCAAFRPGSSAATELRAVEGGLA